MIRFQCSQKRMKFVNERFLFPIIPDKTALVIVDIQQRLFQAIDPEFHKNIRKNIPILIKSSPIAQIPIIITEQYPKGLGHSIDEITRALEDYKDVHFFEKITFDAWQEKSFVQYFSKHSFEHIIITGIETHICVYQTCRSFIRNGYSVHVPIDAVASRSVINWDVGVQKMLSAGAGYSSVETILFDLLQTAKDDTFKAISTLVR